VLILVGVTLSIRRGNRLITTCIEVDCERIHSNKSGFCDGCSEKVYRSITRPTTPIRVFETGAKRTSDADNTRYDLISEYGLERLAKTYAEGSRKYSDHNWRAGWPFSVGINHVLKHLNDWKRGDVGEDHLAHAAFGLFALMELEATHPELNDLYSNAKDKEPIE